VRFELPSIAGHGHGGETGGPGDPQLQRRDRETLVPDAAWRKQGLGGSSA
jgi:hypothetical protein